MTSMLKFVPDCKGFLNSKTQHNEKVITSLQSPMHKSNMNYRKVLAQETNTNTELIHTNTSPVSRWVFTCLLASTALIR